ncbi:hypothetical protein RDI58_010284 [Solanum bulbocastanum]|uniref:NAC domain-containing protein n=1 Tax=Solanum bulbocastanum TaxID=147425 RepID=A0AAN8YJC5_SOLBU
MKNKHKGGDNWYFFARRERKYKRGGRPNRQVGGSKGFWKTTGNDVEIKKNDQIIGYKKTLDYQEEKGIKSKWKMHEFRIDKKSSPHEMDKSVLCEIYINKRTNNNEEAIDYRYDEDIIQPTSYNIDGVKYVNGYENIIDHGDPIHEEKLEHGQNFVGINNNLEFYDDHQFVQEITTPNLISSSSNHIDNNVYHYKGFDELGVVVHQYVHNISAKNYNIIQATSDNIDEVKNVNGNDNNVYDFNGFDELSVVVQRYVQMKK